mmetsp:Transcript_6190/g.8042  ORF Transcript_6190/g.8042 Transcript_6190/m.8042 type:complete len:297 (+) Transcript_6190:89-979(+)
MASSSSSAREKKKIKFIVTGFGPFHGVKNNPTTIIAEKLVDFLKQQQQQLQQQESSSDDLLLSKTIADNTRTLVLETSVEDVQRQVDQIYDDICKEEQEEQEQEKQTSTSTSTTVTILLHLGVHYGAQKFHIESCAYNNANFRTSDERGFQPTNEPITPSYELEAAFETALDVNELLSSAAALLLLPEGSDNRICTNGDNDGGDGDNDKGTLLHSEQLAATISNDPGRFVCNYTYCYSMHKFGCSRSINGQECSSISNKTRCLFLHVPQFTIVPEQEQLTFVAKLMTAIYEQALNL